MSRAILFKDNRQGSSLHYIMYGSQRIQTSLVVHLSFLLMVFGLTLPFSAANLARTGRDKAFRNAVGSLDKSHVIQDMQGGKIMVGVKLGLAKRKEVTASSNFFGTADYKGRELGPNVKRLPLPRTDGIAIEAGKAGNSQGKIRDQSMTAFSLLPDKTPHRSSFKSGLFSNSMQHTGLGLAEKRFEVFNDNKGKPLNSDAEDPALSGWKTLGNGGVYPHAWSGVRSLSENAKKKVNLDGLDDSSPPKTHHVPLTLILRISPRSYSDPSPSIVPRRTGRPGETPMANDRNDNLSGHISPGKTRLGLLLTGSKEKREKVMPRSAILTFVSAGREAVKAKVGKPDSRRAILARETTTRGDSFLPSGNHLSGEGSDGGYDKRMGIYHPVKSVNGVAHIIRFPTSGGKTRRRGNVVSVGRQRRDATKEETIATSQSSPVALATEEGQSSPLGNINKTNDDKLPTMASVDLGPIPELFREVNNLTNSRANNSDALNDDVTVDSTTDGDVNKTIKQSDNSTQNLVKTMKPTMPSDVIPTPSSNILATISLGKSESGTDWKWPMLSDQTTAASLVLDDEESKPTYVTKQDGPGNKTNDVVDHTNQTGDQVNYEKTEPEPEPEPEPESTPEPSPEPELKSTAEPTSEKQPDTTLQPIPEDPTEAKVGRAQEPTPEPTSEPTTESTTEPEPETSPATEPETTPELKPGPVSSAIPEPVTAGKPESEPGSSAEPEPGTVDEPETETKSFVEPDPTTSGKPEPEPEPEPEGRGRDDPSNQPRSEPGPEWESAKRMWRQAWEVHIYAFGGLFAAVGLYSLISLVRLWRIQRLLSKPYFISLNVLMLLMCATRSFYLLYDPYNSGGTFPISLDYFLYSISFPCLTSAFSVLLYSLLKATHMQLVSPSVQRLPVLTFIVISHFVLSIATDILLGMYAGMQVMLFVCQVYFIVWGLFLFFGYAHIFRKIYAHAVKRQKNLYDQNSGSGGGGGGTNPNGSRGGSGGSSGKSRYTLSTAIKVTFFTAICGLITVGLEVYAIVEVYKTFTLEQPKPWPWWLYHTVLRVIEFLMSLTMSYVASQPFRYRTGKKSNGDAGGRGGCCSCCCSCGFLCAPCAEIVCCGHTINRQGSGAAGWSEIEFQARSFSKMTTFKNGTRDSYNTGSTRHLFLDDLTDSTPIVDRQPSPAMRTSTLRRFAEENSYVQFNPNPGNNATEVVPPYSELFPGEDNHAHNVSTFRLRDGFVNTGYAGTVPNGKNIQNEGSANGSLQNLSHANSEISNDFFKAPSSVSLANSMKNELEKAFESFRLDSSIDDDPDNKSIDLIIASNLPNMRETDLLSVDSIPDCKDDFAQSGEISACSEVKSPSEAEIPEDLTQLRDVPSPRVPSVVRRVKSSELETPHGENGTYEDGKKLSRSFSEQAGHRGNCDNDSDVVYPTLLEMEPKDNSSSMNSDGTRIIFNAGRTMNEGEGQTAAILTSLLQPGYKDEVDV